MPTVDPRISPTRWHLTPAARQASRLLAEVLPANALLVSSTETKAMETAQEIQSVAGGSIVTDDRLTEVAHHGTWQDDHATLARQYVAGRCHDGWEDHAEVVSRFRSAVLESLDRADSQPLVVVTHGQAMSTWLASGAQLVDPVEFWTSLRFPDAWRLSGADGAAPTGSRLRRVEPPPS
jgi:broad specificity phosphatase PhoE